MDDKECNAVYDGYSYQSMWLGCSYATNFSHMHDFEPATLNHTVPHYGIFSRLYFTYMLDAVKNQDKGYTSFKKDQGPPNKTYSQEYDELEHNDYLASKSIDPESVRHPARKQKDATAAV